MIVWMYKINQREDDVECIEYAKKAEYWVLTHIDGVPFTPTMTQSYHPRWNKDEFDTRRDALMALRVKVQQNIVALGHCLDAANANLEIEWLEDQVMRIKYPEKLDI